MNEHTFNADTLASSGNVSPAPESVQPGEVPSLVDMKGQRVVDQDLVWSLNVWVEDENHESVLRGDVAKIPVLCRLVHLGKCWNIVPTDRKGGSTGCPPDLAKGRFGIYKADDPEPLLVGRDTPNGADQPKEAKTK